MEARAALASKGICSSMGDRQALARLAQRLNRDAGAPAIPPLFFFTDPARTPDPVAIAGQLPRGAAIVFRHFGATDRVRTARALARVARKRGLTLLIAADPALARRVGADGVHWPEKRLASPLRFGLTTASAHSPAAAARAAALGVDAIILGPVFPSRSPSAKRPLGAFHASQIARSAGPPVIALGGVSAKTARTLVGRGFAGCAAIEALA
ncbi:thiamin-phosphate pyrophosphorylase [alpha proteobacterium U9-1i]|nr:thiamin-phosphate pyrophosphorylase [alpha proteobacterium U9-1i]